MKKVITLSLAAALSTTAFASSSIQSQIDELKEKIAQLEKKQKSNTKRISKVNKLANNDNLKFNVDFRPAYDYVSYKAANGDKKSNSIFSNRLWVNMAYAPTENLYFYATLAYYKTYGQSVLPKQGFNYYDWIVNETANPSDELRVKEAFFLYKNDTFLGFDIPWTASIGRRPSTDGLLVNYREDQKAKSAIGHNINMEFDGASFGYQLENVIGVEGMFLKFCLGRGMSNVNSRYSGLSSNGDGTFSVNGTLDYAKVDGFSNTDLLGVLFNPYDDGQYSVHTVWFDALNLPGMYATDNTYSKFTFEQQGDVQGGAIAFVADGIGDGISDMLDDTVFFASLAYSKTDPDSGKTMLGSSDKKTGTSFYVGANWACQLIDDARVGVEYNHGSKYWRSFTYGEDTMAGSKLATRGDAYEIWFNKELIGKKLTAQVRYTYMDYKYTGSQAFFGDGGAPMSIDQAVARGLNPIDSAQDVRFYIRYRY
ncbi:hypothetical protein MNB_SV-4-341 [hydrothermal vent metagenome]|uniref:DUF3373 domain-containing protein n=1 Tax=hydrothermal vent metagenome TaxID=652676 RepID=A0A1W1E9N6_9ZZZZ